MLKILIKSFCLFFLVVLTIWIVVLGMLQTKPVQKWIIDSSLAYIEKKTGSHLEIGDIEFIFPLTLRLKKLSLIQNGETLATIEKISATCTYAALLQGRVILSTLNAEGINLLKMPLNKEETNVNEKEKILSTWGGKLFPFYLKIENLFLDNIRIHPDVISELKIGSPHDEVAAHSRLSIKGFISNNPFRKGIYSHLKLLIEDVSAPAHPISLLIHTQRDFLTLTFAGNHLPKELTKSLMFDSKFAIDASAPLNSWQELLQNKNDGTNGIEGRFKLAIKSTEPLSWLAGVVGDLTVVEGAYSLGSNKEFVVQQVSIKNEALEITGKGEISGELAIRTCQFCGHTKSMDKISPWIAKHLQDHLTFNGSLSGSIDNPSLNLDALIPELNVKGEVFNHVIASLNATLNDRQTHGAFHLDFNFKNQPCHIASLFQHHSDELTISHLELNGLNSNVTGELALELSEKIWRGDLQAHANDLNEWSFLLPQPIEGEAHLDIHLFPSSINKMPSINCILTANSLHSNELHADQLFSTINLVPFSNGDELFHVTSTVEGKNLYRYSNQIAFFTLKTSHQSDLMHTNVRDLKVTLNGDQIQWADGSVKEVDLYAEWDNPLKDIDGQIKFAVRNMNSGSLIVENVEGETTFLASSNEWPFKINGFGKWFEKWDAKAEGLWFFDNKGIRFKSAISGFGKNPDIAEGTLPITFSLSPLAFNRGSDIPFSLNLQAEGELDPYLRLFYNDVTTVTGQTKIALNLSGRMDDPHIQGTVELYNGSFESLDTGALYKNIEARFEGTGSKVLLTHFIAHDNKQGSITATGEISIDKNNDFPFEFKINPSQIYIMNSDYASVSVSGPLTLGGNSKKAVLKGNLVSDSAIVHLEQALPKQIKHIDIKYINSGDDEPHHNLTTKRGNDFIELDVNLTFPGEVKIEGKNFTSEWKGTIAASGTPDDPLFYGDLRVVNGEYNFNGKAFTLTQGNIHFAGDPAKKTSLYIIAGKDFDRIHAEIIVKGPTSKPVVSFRSNPPLSQREVLSYILFNRGIADITSDQGDQLSQSFIELNDSDQSSSGKDFLTRLRNNIGIDRLDITSSDNANQDVSLHIGKYITEKVFVSVNKSISDVGNRVAIEADILKNLKAQAEVEVGGDTQGKVSLKWKKDY